VPSRHILARQTIDHGLIGHLSRNRDRTDHAIIRIAAIARRLATAIRMQPRAVFVALFK
jgi:hypothetical protein